MYSVNDPLELVDAGSETGIRGRGGAMAAEELKRRFGDDCAGERHFCQYARHTFIGSMGESRGQIQAHCNPNRESW